MKFKTVKKGEKLYMQMPVEVKTIDKEAGTLEAIFSTQDIDRHGDTVMQDGWDLSAFKKNPVILNSHNYGDAADVIGKASNVKIEKKKLQGKITFAVAENPKAKVIFDLYAGGYLNAFSVGFIVKSFKEDKQGNIDFYTISEAELLEVSAVSVPANARALAKSKGIDVDALKSKEQSDDDNNDEEPESDTDDEEQSDEVSEDNEVSETDEQAPTEDGDDSEGGSEEDTNDGGDDAGDQAGGDVDPSEGEDEDTDDDEVDEEPEATPTPVQASYKSKVSKAIKKIEEREHRNLKRAHKIIQGLLDGDTEGKKFDQQTQKKVKNRKINQAIRSLMKVK